MKKLSRKVEFTKADQKGFKDYKNLWKKKIKLSAIIQNKYMKLLIHMFS
jgi:hypothetical protein